MRHTAGTTPIDSSNTPSAIVNVASSSVASSTQPKSYFIGSATVTPASDKCALSQIAKSSPKQLGFMKFGPGVLTSKRSVVTHSACWSISESFATKHNQAGTENYL